MSFVVRVKAVLLPLVLVWISILTLVNASQNPITTSEGLHVVNTVSDDSSEESSLRLLLVSSFNHLGDESILSLGGRGSFLTPRESSLALRDDDDYSSRRKLLTGEDIIELLSPEQQLIVKETLQKLTPEARLLVETLLSTRFQKHFFAVVVRRTIAKFFQQLPPGVQKGIHGIVNLLPPGFQKVVREFIADGAENDTVPQNYFRIREFLNKLPKPLQAIIENKINELPRVARILILDLIDEPIPKDLIQDLFKKIFSAIFKHNLDESARQKVDELLRLMPNDARQSISSYLSAQGQVQTFSILNEISPYKNDNSSRSGDNSEGATLLALYQVLMDGGAMIDSTNASKGAASDRDSATYVPALQIISNHCDGGQKKSSQGCPQAPSSSSSIPASLKLRK